LIPREPDALFSIQDGLAAAAGEVDAPRVGFDDVRGDRTREDA